VEAYLNSSKNLFNEQQLLSSLDEDITPISDFRSDAEFRRQVCGNYLIDFLHSLNNPQAGS
jgi:xanthine dehydrogenase iron-sulfur cluster and FAD-binding subunit A